MYWEKMLQHFSFSTPSLAYDSVYISILGVVGSTSVKLKQLNNKPLELLDINQFRILATGDNQNDVMIHW